MPDYNPAVALDLKPPENSLAQTFNTIANLQQTQAHTGLYQLQAAQQQRDLNSKRAYANAISSGQTPAQAIHAFVINGGNPADLNQLQTASEMQTELDRGGGLSMASLERQTAATKNRAETSNLGVQHQIYQADLAKKDMEYRGGAAQSMLNDPSDENWNANAANLRGHVSPQGWAQIQGAKTPEQRKNVAQSMIDAATPTQEFVKPVPMQPGEGFSTVGRLQARPVPGPSGAAPSPAVIPPLSPQAKEMQTQTAAKTIDYLQGEGNKQYSSAQALLGRMTTIDHNIEALGPRWMGAGADTKAEMAKAWNSTLETFGVDQKFHFDPGKVATWEEFNKEQIRAGMELINSNFGGSKEAASIIQMGRTAVTGVQNSYIGAKYISATIKAAAQRQSDLFEYQAQHPDQLPAVSAITFNKTHPPQQYGMSAIAEVIPQAAKQHLIEHPDLASHFDKQFGKGAAEFVLGPTAR